MNRSGRQGPGWARGGIFSTSLHGARALLALLSLLLILAPMSPPLDGGRAEAQILDYGNLFGGKSADAPASEDKAAPAAPGGGPNLSAYGTLTDYGAESMISRTTEGVSAFRQRMRRILRKAPDALDDVRRALAAAAPDGQAGYFVGVFVVTVLLLMIGRAAVVLYAIYIARAVMVAAQRGPRPVLLSDKLPVLALRLLLTLIALVINLSVAVGLGFALMPDHGPTEVTVALILGAYATYMMVDNAWRMVISPYLSEYRIPMMSDADARKLYLWISTTAAVGISVLAFSQWMQELGLPQDLQTLIYITLSLVADILILVLVWMNRRAITRAMLGGLPKSRASWLAAVAATVWAPAVTVYFIAAWLEGSYRVVMGLEQRIPLSAGALATLMAALIVYAVTIFIVERLFSRAQRRRQINAELNEAAKAERRARAEVAAGTAAEVASHPPQAAAPATQGAAPTLTVYSGDDGDMDGDGDDEGGGPAPVTFAQPAPTIEDPDARRGMTSYEDLARRVASLFAIGAAGWVLLLIWGGQDMFSEGSRYAILLSVADKLFIGYIVYHAMRIWLDQKIASEGGDNVLAAPGDEGGGASASSRLATLLPLFRTTILAITGVSIGLLVAMELGVNVAPLFAGAGVVGLAIGFGAQTLVRDILSGVFFLVDDAFRKGEYIDVGEVKGTVEKISIRSLQLRHHLGALNTIPFGEIRYLTNFARDWVMMKLPLRLTYDTDVEKVRKLVKKLGQELLEHPTEGKKFLQPLKSQGVYMMEDSAMILRVKFMTRPGDQWTTRKLVYQRLREVFEQEGIKFAAREVTVRMPDLPDAADDARPTIAHAAGAAARRVIEDSETGGGAALAEGR